MNINETKQMLEKIGMKGIVSTTGHPDYKRIFIRDSEGVQQGRITIINDEYHHVRWYFQKLHELRCQLMDSEKAAISFGLMLDGFEKLTDDEWVVAIEKANKIVEDKYQESVAARALLPNKKRKSLKKRNFRNYLPEIAKQIAYEK